MVEVDCGSDDILRHLRHEFHDTKLVGYDIYPQVQAFWHAAVQESSFCLKDFHKNNMKKYDVLLMLDVI
jgi:hypothetical protein